eukprot:171320-Hanusia_phi.AAC.3
MDKPSLASGILASPETGSFLSFTCMLPDLSSYAAFLAYRNCSEQARLLSMGNELQGRTREWFEDTKPANIANASDIFSLT